MTANRIIVEIRTWRIIVQKMLGNVQADQMKNKILFTQSKCWLNSKSVFVPHELSFGNSHSWKQYVLQIILTFQWKILFHPKFDIFSLKSQEKARISAKKVCIIFAQYYKYVKMGKNCMYSLYVQCILTIFVEHGIIAHTLWWLSQSKLLNCIIQWYSFKKIGA